VKCGSWLRPMIRRIEQTVRFPVGEDGPDGEELGLDPGEIGEQWCEGSQGGYHLGW